MQLGENVSIGLTAVGAWGNVEARDDISLHPEIILGKEEKVAIFMFCLPFSVGKVSE